MAKIIAEMSGNHNGSLEKALEIVRAVSRSGAHYLKIQTYTADTITLPVSGGLFNVSDDHEIWGSRNLYDLYTEAHTPWEWHKPIFDLATDLGLIPFSTPFDETAVDFLEELDVQLYKIASLEVIDTPLIKRVAETGKPMIISTGTATLGEIEDAVAAARNGGCLDLTLMLCTSSYPALPADTHLARIAILKNLFNVDVGLSDHTKGINVSIAAIALGAQYIEKHVKLDKNDIGVDSTFSINAEELASLVAANQEVVDALGNAFTWRKSTELESLRHRPSIYITRNVKKGEVVTSQNIRTIRPSGGLKPKYFDSLLGKRFSRNAEIGEPATFDIIE